jgi:hypothetical protein
MDWATPMMLEMVAAAEVQHLCLAHRPSEFDRRLPVVEEVGDERAAGHEEAAAPEWECNAGLQLLQARQVEAARRHVFLAADRDQRLCPALAPRMKTHGFGEQPELRLGLDSIAHGNSSQCSDARTALRRERAP